MHANNKLVRGNSQQLLTVSLTLIVLVGFLIRFYIILRRDIFTDEVFYLETSINKSFWDLITINHWIKDHGILYFLLLKIGSYFSYNIIHLRTFNLFFYIVSAVFLIKLFYALDLKKYTYIPLLIFSFSRYFVYISTLLVPYNLVYTLFIISVFFSCKLINKDNKKVEGLNLSLILLFSALSFYSDYSSVYNFIYILFVVFQVLKKQIYRYTDKILLFGLILLPGVLQIFGNWKKISDLFGYERQLMYSANQISIHFQDLLRTNLFRIDLVSSYLALLLLLFLVFLVIKYKNALNHRHAYLFFAICAYSLFASILLLLLITRFLLPVMIERTYWFFYLIQIFLYALLVIFFIKLNSRIYIGILIFFVVMFTLQYLYPSTHNFYVNGDVGQGEVHYTTLIGELAAKKTNSKESVIFYDRHTTYIPLKNYYFSFYPKTAKHYNNIVQVRSKYDMQFINHDEEFYRLLSQYEAKKKNYIVVMFDFEVSNIRRLLSKFNLRFGTIYFQQSVYGDPNVSKLKKFDINHDW